MKDKKTQKRCTLWEYCGRYSQYSVGLSKNVHRVWLFGVSKMHQGPTCHFSGKETSLEGVPNVKMTRDSLNARKGPPDALLRAKRNRTWHRNIANCILLRHQSWKPTKPWAVYKWRLERTVVTWTFSTKDPWNGKWISCCLRMCFSCIYLYLAPSICANMTSGCWQEAWQSEWRPCTSMDVPAKHEWFHLRLAHRWGNWHAPIPCTLTQLKELGSPCQPSWDNFEVTQNMKVK